MKELCGGVLPYLGTERLCVQTPLELLIERILSVMTVLGLTCLCIGFFVHIIGRVFNDLLIAQVGAYILVIGIVFAATKLLYWIMEKIVLRGLEFLKRRNKTQFMLPLLRFSICLNVQT